LGKSLSEHFKLFNFCNNLTLRIAFKLSRHVRLHRYNIRLGWDRTDGLDSDIDAARLLNVSEQALHLSITPTSTNTIPTQCNSLQTVNEIVLLPFYDTCTKLKVYQPIIPRSNIQSNQLKSLGVNNRSYNDVYELYRITRFSPLNATFSIQDCLDPKCTKCEPAVSYNEFFPPYYGTDPFNSELNFDRTRTFITSIFDDSAVTANDTGTTITNIDSNPHCISSYDAPRNSTSQFLPDYFQQTFLLDMESDGTSPYLLPASLWNNASTLYPNGTVTLYTDFKNTTQEIGTIQRCDGCGNNYIGLALLIIGVFASVFAMRWCWVSWYRKTVHAKKLEDEAMMRDGVILEAVLAADGSVTTWEARPVHKLNP
jgi:hypothetical protein